MKYPFLVSVIMAVYNAESYLAEAIESIVHQSLGLQNIQLILVDDGSADRSAEICDQYAKVYPSNITVLHQANQGVAEARNHGMDVATGKYLNFMDSDDRMGGDALKKMVSFMDAHADETDIATVPIRFFGDTEGDHPQNLKFEQGSRVLHLTQEPQNVLFFVNASLFSAHLKDRIRFDGTLPVAEDFKFIYTALADKPSIGLVADSVYWYRRHAQQSPSLVSSKARKKSFYFEYFDNLIFWLRDYYVDRLGFLPSYVQHAFATDLQWRFVNSNREDNNILVQEGILSQEEFVAYKKRLKRALALIEDAFLFHEIFIRHSNDWIRSLYIAGLKYSPDEIRVRCQDHVLFAEREGKALFSIGFWVVKLCDMLFEQNAITFLGSVSVPAGIESEFHLSLGYGDRSERVQWCDVRSTKAQFQTEYLIQKTFRVTLDALAHPRRSLTMTAWIGEGERDAIPCELFFAHTCPVGAKYDFDYYADRNWLLTYTKGTLAIERRNVLNLRVTRAKYAAQLLKKHDPEDLKALVLYPTIAVLKPLVGKRPIWLLSDRWNKADDNAEALFGYINRQDRSLRAWYVLRPDAPDWDRIKAEGRLVKAFSFRHKVLYALCDANISSQADELTINPFYGHHEPYRKITYGKRLYFLQHGIIGNNISPWLNRFTKPLSLCVSTTNAECTSLKQSCYGYEEGVVRLTGLPRHDRLYSKPERMILIAPTWRSRLVTGFIKQTGRREVLPGFADSAYCQNYGRLLCDPTLMDAAERTGYRIAFFSHPNMRACEKEMTFDPRVLLLPEGIAYRDLFARADLLVTDYSSVAFDFAYLRKPVLYFQADKEAFFRQQTTMESGYFDYERDGFGEVEGTPEGLRDRIVAYMQGGCTLKAEYRARIDRTFPFADRDNCRRVYEAIREISESSGAVGRKGS